jgi:hypothetical protein
VPGAASSHAIVSISSGSNVRFPGIRDKTSIGASLPKARRASQAQPQPQGHGSSQTSADGHATCCPCPALAPHVAATVQAILTESLFNLSPGIGCSVWAWSSVPRASPAMVSDPSYDLAISTTAASTARGRHRLQPRQHSFPTLDRGTTRTCLVGSVQRCWPPTINTLAPYRVALRRPLD